MNILILNWRDIKNPKSGGAEVLTHEIAKNWVKKGHRVTIFSSHFQDALPAEIMDGVKVIRKGHPDIRFLFASVHFLAFLYYIQNSKSFDAVVDEIHGIPFFTPWYVKTKKVALICEVASNLWVKMFGTLFGTVGRLMEEFYLGYVYKEIPYLTISNSTKKELIKEGVDEKNITVLPMGVTAPKALGKKKKENPPSLIFVGRLSKSKGIEDAILALKEVSKIYKNIKLWIVGGGDKDYVDYLKKMVKRLRMEDMVIFFGFVSENKKFELMGKAYILIAPSMKEGWGLTVPEAGKVGTPAIGYNVEGLRDVILNGRTGILTSKNNYTELAKEIIKMLENNSKYKSYAKAANIMSLSYNWENTAKVALQVLKR